MSTIHDPQVVSEMLRNNGTYPGDPQAAVILSYRNSQDKQLQGAVYWPNTQLAGQLAGMLASPYVQDPQLLWTQAGGLTQAGREWLARHP